MFTTQLLFRNLETVLDSDIFLASYPRSGNTWFRRLLADVILQINGFNTETDLPVPLQKIIPDIYEDDINDLDSRVKLPFRIIKTHDLYRKNYNKVIYIYRNPLDTLYSYYCFNWNNSTGTSDLLKTPDRFCNQKVDEWCQHIESYVQARSNIVSSVLFFTYEDMHRYPIQTLNKISVFCGIKASTSICQKAIQNQNFSRIRSKEKNKNYSKYFYRRGEIGDAKNHLAANTVAFLGKRTSSTYSKALLLKEVNRTEIAANTTNNGEIQKCFRAVNALNSNQNENALSFFDEIAHVKNNVPSIDYGRALALARLGYIENSIKTLARLISNEPNHRKANLLLEELNTSQIEFFTKRANKLLNSNQVASAFRFLNQAKAFKKPTFNLDYLRAICALRFNRILESREFLNEELRYFPQNQEAQDLLNRIEGSIAQHPHLTTGQIHDSEFQKMRELVRSHTMLSEARLYSLFSLVKRVCIEDIPGNIVECGVAGGGSTALMAMAIERYTQRPRLLYAFDSFEGMPSPSERDKASGVPANATGWGTGTCASPEEKVQEVLVQLGVRDIVQTVKGDFQDTLPKMRQEIGSIALLHMDGDWYESTKAILNNYYDLVVSKGFIQADDYGHWEGCREAIHEFEQQRQLEFELHFIDYSGVWYPIPNES